MFKYREKPYLTADPLKKDERGLLCPPQMRDSVTNNPGRFLKIYSYNAAENNYLIPTIEQ